MNEDFTKYEYLIKEPNENDPTAIVIEKRNITADFTIGEQRVQRAQVAKTIKELTAKHALEEAKVTNIREHHPDIAAMSMEDLFAAHMFYEAIALVNGLPPKIKEFQDAYDESIAEEAYMQEVLGVDFNGPVKPTPAEAVDTAMASLDKGEPQVAPEAAPEAPTA